MPVAFSKNVSAKNLKKLVKAFAIKNLMLLVQHSSLLKMPESVRLDWKIGSLLEVEHVMNKVMSYIKDVSYLRD